MAKKEIEKPIKATEPKKPVAKKAAKETAAKSIKSAKVEKVVAPEPVSTDVKVPAKPNKPTKTKVISGKMSAKKSATIKKFQKSDKDTGSTSVQIAVLTEKINQLSKHLADHKKDNDSRMGLLKMISHRRSLLSYLDKRQPEEYRQLLASLGLRK